MNQRRADRPAFFVSEAGLRGAANPLYFPAMQDHQPQDPMIHRLAAFADAVVAIVMTLLALDIRLPVPAGDLGDAELLQALIGIAPKYYAYALSFVVIALNWVFHHRRFRAIVGYDATLIWINLAFLLFIAIVPFPTSLIAERGSDPQVVTLYASTVAILGILGAGTWAYAHRAGLLSTTIDRSLYIYILGGNLVAPVVFLLSIPLVYLLQALRLDTSWALWFWVLNWVVGAIWDRAVGSRPATGSSMPPGRGPVR